MRSRGSFRGKGLSFDMYSLEQRGKENESHLPWTHGALTVLAVASLLMVAQARAHAQSFSDILPNAPSALLLSASVAANANALPVEDQTAAQNAAQNPSPNAAQNPSQNAPPLPPTIGHASTAGQTADAWSARSGSGPGRVSHAAALPKAGAQGGSADRLPARPGASLRGPTAAYRRYRECETAYVGAEGRPGRSCRY
jgi:hypothetical protein